MKRPTRGCGCAIAVLVLLLGAGVNASAGDLDNSFVKGNELKYRSYEVTRSLDSRTGVSSATIKRHGALLVRLQKGEGLAGIESTRFGLFPFLGKKTKQLIVQQYTGGAHCCFIYTIYELFPRFRLIFSSEKYPVGDGFEELQPVNLDHDDIYELPQRIMTFDYFEGLLGYPNSPATKVVFKYDRALQKYVPANRRFAKHILKGIDKYKRLVANDKYAFYALLQVVVSYIYSGRQKEGWRYLESQYSDADKNDLRRKIEQTLRGCPVYNSIYRRSVRKK